MTTLYSILAQLRPVLDTMFSITAFLGGAIVVMFVVGWLIGWIGVGFCAVAPSC